MRFKLEAACEQVFDHVWKTSSIKVGTLVVAMQVDDFVDVPCGSLLFQEGTCFPTETDLEQAYARSPRSPPYMPILKSSTRQSRLDP
jgi:hypothetical protein